MPVLIIHTQSRLRVLGASKSRPSRPRAFSSFGPFVLRLFCPSAFLDNIRQQTNVQPASRL